MAGRKSGPRSAAIDNLKRWLAQTAWRLGRCRPRFRSGGRHAGDHSWSAGLRQSMCARAIAGEWKLPLVKFDYRRHLRQVHWRNRKAYPESVSRRRRPCTCVFGLTNWKKSLCRKRAGFSIRRCRSFLANPGCLPFLDAGSQGSRICAATCNNVTVLPPELIRKGPLRRTVLRRPANQAERKQIFAIHLTRRKPQSGGI